MRCKVRVVECAASEAELSRSVLKLENRVPILLRATDDCEKHIHNEVRAPSYSTMRSLQGVG
jgi:hypothetical protein